MAERWLFEHLNGRGPASVIVRHAERFPVRSIYDSLAVGLTEKGKEDAVTFGRSIEGSWEVRLFHSPAVRCRETAEGIADGLGINGHRVRSIEEAGTLCAPYLKDPRVLGDADRLGYAFMRSWFDGSFDRAWLSPTSEAADMVLAPVIKSLRSSSSPRSLDIHVSHDWEIVLLREEVLGIKYEDAGWVDYLEGLMFTATGDGYTAASAQGQRRFFFRDGHRLEE